MKNPPCANRTSYYSDLYRLFGFGFTMRPSSGDKRVLVRQHIQHILTPVDYPDVLHLGQKQIDYFLRERERYFLCFQDARTGGSSSNAISIKCSVEPDLLLFLMELGQFGHLYLCSRKTPSVDSSRYSIGTKLFSEHASGRNLLKKTGNLLSLIFACH